MIYYVRKSGNDANNGYTEATAKLTIAGAYTASTTGDTIDIGAGEFVENIGASGRTYRGAGMFKTTVVGYLAWASLIAAVTLQDMRINLAGTGQTYLVFNGGTYKFIRVYFDGGGYSWTPGVGFFYPNSTSTIQVISSVFVNHVLNSRAFFDMRNTNDKLEIYGSTFYGITASYISFVPSTGGNVTTKNSIFSTCTTGGVANATIWTHTYNCYYSITTPTLSTGEISANPLFNDPGGGDFRLQSGSPCIGAGLP